MRSFIFFLLGVVAGVAGVFGFFYYELTQIHFTAP